MKDFFRITWVHYSTEYENKGLGVFIHLNAEMLHNTYLKKNNRAAGPTGICFQRRSVRKSFSFIKKADHKHLSETNFKSQGYSKLLACTRGRVSPFLWWPETYQCSYNHVHDPSCFVFPVWQECLRQAAASPPFIIWMLNACLVRMARTDDTPELISMRPLQQLLHHETSTTPAPDAATNPRQGFHVSGCRQLVFDSFILNGRRARTAMATRVTNVITARRWSSATKSASFMAPAPHEWK